MFLLLQCTNIYLTKIDRNERDIYKHTIFIFLEIKTFYQSNCQTIVSLSYTTQDLNYSVEFSFSERNVLAILIKCRIYDLANLCIFFF